MRIALFALLLLLPLSSEAQRHPVRVTLVPGFRGLDRPQAEQALTTALGWLKDAGVRLRRGKFTELAEDPCASIERTSANFIPSFWCLYQEYSRHPLGKVNALSYYMQPPLFFPNGGAGVGGVARTVCAKDKLSRMASGNGVATSSTGDDRLLVSAGVMAHELGHLLGAQHDDTNANFMHSAAGSFWVQGFGFQWNEQGKSQMRRCNAAYNRRFRNSRRPGSGRAGTSLVQTALGCPQDRGSQGVLAVDSGIVP